MLIKRYLTDGEGGGAATETTPKPAEGVVSLQSGGGAGGAAEDAAGGEQLGKPEPFHKHPDWIKHQERMKTAETKAAELEEQMGELTDVLAQYEEKLGALKGPGKASRIQELVEKSKTGEELTQGEIVELFLEQQKQFEGRLSDLAMSGEEKDAQALRDATTQQLKETYPFYAVGTIPDDPVTGRKGGKSGNYLALSVLGNMMARVDPTGKDSRKASALAPKVQELVLGSIPDLIVWGAGAKDPGILGSLPKALDAALAAKDPGIVKWLDAHAQGWIEKKGQQETQIPPGGGGGAGPVNQRAPLAKTINEARERMAKRFEK